MYQCSVRLGNSSISSRIVTPDALSKLLKREGRAG